MHVFDAAVGMAAGELLVGPKKVLFLDEISTGLDSSTTFQISRTLRHFCHLRDATMLVALLQPTPETYNLFDDILLMSEGRCCFPPNARRVVQGAVQPEQHHKRRHLVSSCLVPCTCFSAETPVTYTLVGSACS